MHDERIHDGDDDGLDDLLTDGPATNDTGDWTTRRATWRVSEIARELKCSDRIVRLYCERGQLPAARTAGGHYRVDARALRVFLRGHDAPLAA